MSETDIAAREAELARREQALAAEREQLETRRRELDAGQASLRQAGHVAFADGLVASGRLLPAEALAVAALLGRLDDGQTVELGEGAVPSLDAFKGFLGGLPVRVDFQERAAAGGDTIDLSDPAGVAAEARRYQDEQARAGVAVSTDQAVRHVIGRNAA